jgi:hypothetical protein
MNAMMTRLAVVAATLTMASPALAGRIVRREVNQQARIAQGVRSGELTAAETARLEAREAILNREIRRDRVDGGGLSTHERAKIERQQDRLSRSIYRQKHDAQDR